MTILETIQKAIEGGYKTIRKNLDGSPAPQKEIQEIYQVLLDPLFWQSLGKALGWAESKEPYLCKGCQTIGLGKDNHLMACLIKDRPSDYLTYWHHFIDHLASGKSVESFFEELK